MDRFKFRAWSKKYNVMWGVAALSWIVEHDYDEPEREISNEVQTIGACEIETMITKVGGNPIKDCILMQCTGLKDKNGKLIFEGDIVRYFWNEDDESEHDNPVIVEWSTDISGWVLTDVKDKWFDGLLYKKPTYEVIGNIFQNPELCQQK